jgi:Na+-driven multidrug efflux pump
MGVAGAAWATGLSQLCSALLVCISLRKTKGSYRLSLKKIYPHGDLMKKIIRIGIPAGLQTTMYTISNMIITAGINGFGTTTVAGWVAQGKVDSLYWMINGAFGVTIATFVGQNYGAERHDRVRKCVKVWSMMSLAISLLISAVILLVGQFLFGMFSGDAEVVNLAMLFNWYVVPFYALFLPIELLSGALRGMGVTLIPTLMTAVGICIFRTFWMLVVVPSWHSVQGIMVSYPISWLLTSIVFIVYYRKKRKVLLMYC